MAKPDYRSYLRTLPGKNRYDLSRLFATPEVLTQALTDLAAPFRTQGVTKVAALDALGFVLGGGVAPLLGAGLILVRKQGKVPWHTRHTTFIDYSGKTKGFEIAGDAVTPGDRVLIVDDWSETGAQLTAAISLLEGAGSSVVGAALIGMDSSVAQAPTLSRYTLQSLLQEDG